VPRVPPSRSATPKLSNPSKGNRTRTSPRAPRRRGASWTPGPSSTRSCPGDRLADGAHQVQGSIDLQGLLQGRPSDLHEGDPAGRVPSVADLVAVMRDGLAEGRHDGEPRAGEQPGLGRERRGHQPPPSCRAVRSRCRMEGKGHASGVTRGQSPRMLGAWRMAARGGGARTGRRGEAERARARGLGVRRGERAPHVLVARRGHAPAFPTPEPGPAGECRRPVPSARAK
jgi:hypothetical protein